MTSAPAKKIAIQAVRKSGLRVTTQAIALCADAEGYPEERVGIDEERERGRDHAHDPAGIGRRMQLGLGRRSMRYAQSGLRRS